MAVYTAINDPSAYFQPHIYTGNNSGSGQTITFGGNSDLQPDLTWIKCRNSTSFNHYIVDSSRGENNSVHLRLVPNGTQVDGDGYTDNFSSDGFRCVNDNGTVNGNQTYVSWNWKANGGTKTTVTATGDYMENTHQANTTAGFSIMTWTGTGTNKKVRHGLSSKADWIMIKNRDQADNWTVWSRGRANESASASFKLNTDDATSASPNPHGSDLGGNDYFWVVGADHEVNANTEKYVAFAWNNVQGYSKAGLYVGNSTSGDGAFVYTGFKPAFVLTKASSAADGSWSLRDNKRDPYNFTNQRLRADTADDEDQDWNLDFLSNGFKWYDGGGATNYAGETYIYLAFAESPFVTSTGIPATAR